MKAEVWQNGTVGEGAPHQTQRAELDPWTLHGGRREATPESCPDLHVNAFDMRQGF